VRLPALIWAVLRGRASRTLALLLGVCVATTSFAVLTGSARTSRLEVTGTVGANFRSAYDILVRPAGSREAVEARRGLVRPNSLSGVFGGISLGQYDTVRSLPGVEVAAPVAMIGSVVPSVDLTVLVPKSVGGHREVYRVSTRWTADRGLSSLPDSPSYVYVTPQALTSNTTLPRRDSEALPGSGPRTVCPDARTQPGQAKGPFDPDYRSQFSCWSQVNGHDGNGGFPGIPVGRAGAILGHPLPTLIAAIDPVAEAALDHVDKAVVQGRFLRGTDRPDSVPAQDSTVDAVPVLAATSTFVQETAHVTVERLPPAAVQQVLAGTDAVALQRGLAGLPGQLVTRQDVTADQAYQQVLASLAGHTAGSQLGVDVVDGYRSAGPVGYRARPDGHLMPTSVRNPGSVWASRYAFDGYVNTPASAQDQGFRQLTAHQGVVNQEHGTQIGFPVLRTVGRFDPSRLPGLSALSAVPLETYNPPVATGADPSSRRALGGAALQPNADPAGYLASPPLFLTTLASLPAFTNPNRFDGGDSQRPVSVIRVRVAGVTGPDPLSRERVRLAAQRITAATGLDVDVTVGSSPTPVTIDLPAGLFGRPRLALAEGWVSKGVAVRVLQAVDRKSVALFGLVLLVCALFVGNAAAAAVRGRRSELAVLACLGWRPRRLFALVLGELAAIGLAAGLAGAALAWPVGRLVGLGTDPRLVVLSVPAAVGLSLLAGLAPARRAARSDPLAAVRPAVSAPRRARSPRGITGLAVSGLRRTPGRTLLAASALAIGVAGLTVVLAVTVAFSGAVVGTLLGDAVSLQVRGADVAAVATTVALGVLAVADVLYLGVRERSAEFAALLSTGWTDTQVARLLTTEGALIGLLGASAGGAGGLALAAVLVGGVPAAAWQAALLAVAGGTLLAAAASVVPAASVRRLPLARLLAEE